MRPQQTVFYPLLQKQVVVYVLGEFFQTRKWKILFENSNLRFVILLYMTTFYYKIFFKETRLEKLSGVWKEGHGGLKEGDDDLDAIVQLTKL